jgi:hypothetical protein
LQSKIYRSKEALDRQLEEAEKESQEKEQESDVGGKDKKQTNETS